MNKMTISLNRKDIQNAIDKLTIINDKYKKLQNDIAEEVANDGAEYLRKQYQNRSYSLLNNIEPPETPIVYTEQTSTGWRIIASGKDILYDEFGTGEQGKASVDGEFNSYRNKYPLNDYNSGPIVSKHINKYGRHYWFYNGNYTEGIPAGKQVFNTRNYIINEGFEKAKKKVVGDLLSNR